MPIDPLKIIRKNTLRTICACLALLFGTAHAESIIELEKSPNDTRDYRYLELDNGLKVTLIHDPDTETAAAAMDVAIGAGSDPKSRPGLAHFLEHMLFLGTEKYPRPDDYAGFIQQNGGSNNAYTSFDNTNYYFEINANQLEPALDRFAQFFIAPLFTEDLVQREKNAVHSEFTGKLRDDSRRVWSARKMGFNPAHPMTGFTTGNLDTLADRPGTNIRDELISFYNAHYSSNIMSLAIVGRESLDQLQVLATQLFSAVQNRDAKVQKFQTPLFTPQTQAKRINITPLADTRLLTLSFLVPKIEEHRFTRPQSYIGNILGHEGPGSLLSELKRLGWVSALSAGGSTSTRNSTTFDISIALTDAGVKHVYEVTNEVFRSINLIRQSGLPQWLYDESQLIDKLSFRYQEKSNVASVVRALSVRAQDWPAKTLLSGPYQRTRFDRQGIIDILDSLIPQNLQMVVIAPGLTTDKTSQWYDTPYSIEAIPSKVLNGWAQSGTNANIVMPQRNQFLPDNLNLLSTGHGDPLKLIDTPKLQVWHRTDSAFGAPRANLNANIHLPASVVSPHNAVLTDIYVRMVNEQLNEFTYAANLAGLGAGVSSNSRGINITMRGYADGQLEMLGHLVAAMKQVNPDPALFKRIRKDLTEEITNNTLAAPYKQTAGKTYKLLYTPYFTDQERLQALGKISLPDLSAFTDNLYSSLRVVVLSHGNLTAQQTLKRVNIIQQGILKNASAAHVDRLHMVQLPPASTFIDEVQLEHDDTSISLYFQSLNRDRSARARYVILRQLLSQPLYTELRTRQQLGYYVFTYSIDLIQVPSIVIGLQSPTTGPGKLYAATQEFLGNFYNELQAYSEEDIQRIVQSVIAQVEEPDERLRQATSRYWSAIVREDFRFDGSIKFADELRTVTKAEIVELYRQLFIDNSNGRLLVYSAGANITDDLPLPAMETVTDLNQFQADKKLLPPLSLVPGIE